MDNPPKKSFMIEMMQRHQSHHVFMKRPILGIFLAFFLVLSLGNSLAHGTYGLAPMQSHSPLSSEHHHTGPQGAPPSHQHVGSTSNGLINGSFNGIMYQYGNKTERYEGSFNQTSTDIINETHFRSEVTTQSLHLIESVTLTDIYWKVTVFARNLTLGTNESTEVIVDNDTFITDIYPKILNGLIFGSDASNISDYAIDWAYFIDQNDSPLLRIPVNVSYFHFIVNNTEQEISVQPIIFRVFLGLKLYHDILVNTTELLFVWALVNSTYQLTYDVNISSVMVNIWHNQSLFLQVLGAGHYRFEYTELSTAVMFYNVTAFKIHLLSFADGTPVPWQMYPLELYPIRYSQQGVSIEVNYQQGLMRGASIQQSIVQSYQIPSESTSENVTTANQSLSDTANETGNRLALWLLQTVPSFIGYRDNNHNGMLDLQFSVDDGVTMGSNDVPALFGVAEAQEKNVFQYHQQYQLYNASFEIFALNINETILNKELNDTQVNVEVDSIGNVDAFPTPQLTWEEPQETANDTYVFNFTIFYDDVPVTWQRIDGSNITVTMDVGYNYEFVVSPKTKQARLSPTFLYGSVNLPIFSQPNVNISLAVPILSEFLFIAPVQSVADSKGDLNKSQAAAITDVRLRSGNVTLGEVNSSGTKKFYKVGSNNYKRMKTSAMHLVNVMGVFTRSESTDLALGSDAFKLIKNAILDSAQRNVSFQLQYRADIYMLNYPTWNGQQIVHDPTFSITYEAPPVPEDSGPQVVLPTPTFTFTLIPEPQHVQSTSPIVDINELPQGFAVTTVAMTIIGVLLALVLSRGRKKLYL